MSRQTVSGLRNLVSSLEGKVCWAFIAGAGTGSMVTLYFGRKYPRPKVLRNPKLTPELRGYEGEYHMFLQGCDWRVEDAKGIICSSSSPNHSDGPMVVGLNRLVGKIVVRAQVVGVVPDISLLFNDQCSLFTFCHTIKEDSLDNYSVASRRTCLTVKNDITVVGMNRGHV